MKQDQVMALVRAHNMRDNERFRRTVLQIAASSKSPFKEELQALAQIRTLEPLPQASQAFFSAVAPVDIGDLLLADETQAFLLEVAEELQHGAGLRGRGIRPRTRLLFCGPPGNGKTSTAAALAGLLKLTPYEVNLANLVDSFQGTTARNLTKVFEALALGHMVILNEVDSIGNERSNGTAADKERSHTVNVVLTELDRCQNGVLVATSNRSDLLDPALRRRFDEVVEFPAPEPAALARLAAKLELRFGLPYEDSHFGWAEGTSFDAVTKAVMKRARRAALDELRLAPFVPEVA
jgi:SpoVK/Ycf46/Vps4 family AAA+-type ATPase